MKHNFSKVRFTERQLVMILKIKDLLVSNKIPEHLVEDIYYITTGSEGIKDLMIADAIKIESIHRKYIGDVSDKRITKIKLFNENELSNNS